MMTSSDTFKAIRLRGSHAFLNFWTRPASTKPLAVLRIGVAGVLLFQAVALSGSVHALFGRNALISWNALQTVDADLEFAHGPLDLRHIAEWIRPLGITADETVTATYYLYIAGLVGLLLGIGTRFSSVLAFATHLLLTNSAPATTYGVDQFARIALFYCCWMPVGAQLSVDRLIKRNSLSASISARIGLRVLQLHLAVMYLATGLHKAAGPQWWNGEAIWRAVTLPQLAQFDLTWLSSIPLLPMAIGWATLAVEIGYCILVWHGRTRFLAVASIVGMHLGIAAVLGLNSFAFLMIALNVAAFLVPDQVRGAAGLWPQPQVFCSSNATSAQPCKDCYR